MEKKTNERRTETILNISIQITSSLAILSEPFLPFSSSKLKKMLSLEDINWNDAGKINIFKDHKIGAATHLFEKIEDHKIEDQRSKLHTS